MAVVPLVLIQAASTALEGIAVGAEFFSAIGLTAQGVIQTASTLADYIPQAVGVATSL